MMPCKVPFSKWRELCPPAVFLSVAPLALLCAFALVTPPAFAGADGAGAAEVSARFNNVGVAYMNHLFNEKALHSFQDAVRADPSSVVPLVNEGIAYLYMRKLPEAEDALKRAIATNPQSVRAWYALGLAHFGNGDQESALGDFKHALALAPKDADVHYFLGTIYLGQKNYDAAVTEFHEALKVVPLHASARGQVGRIARGVEALPGDHPIKDRHADQLFLWRAGPLRDG